MKITLDYHFLSYSFFIGWVMMWIYAILSKDNTLIAIIGSMLLVTLLVEKIYSHRIDLLLDETLKDFSDFIKALKERFIKE